MGDVRVSHRELLRFTTAVFAATGMSPSDAASVADVLVWANARGVDSHGVVRIPVYLAEIRKGDFKPTAQPLVQNLLPATFVLECNRAAGAVCMMRAAAQAIELSEKFGVGVGLVSNPSHLGAIGRYAQWVAERGHAALVMLGGLPFVAYHGAKVASIGTSPVAIGIPAPAAQDAPLLLDMATSVTSSGRIRDAAAEGKAIPEGMAIDADGKSTTDPRQAKALLPIGGAKGSGLSLMFECLTGILAGTPIIAVLGGASGAKAPIQNAMIVVFNVANFRSLPDYRHDIQQLKEMVKRLPRCDGVSELLLPGERGDREADLRHRTGIPLPEKLWTELGNVAQELGVSPPEAS
ncbi:MAG TPA: Ldh family oxidoreductase [Pseudolabrys sp.]|jgi:ureidoglycolate dehydrogenase (NAD+)